MKISIQFGIRRVIVHEVADIRTNRQAGFSLVELAVAVFIIGLIASMSFGAIKAQMINSAIRVTKGNQDTIKDALIAYLGKYRRLPCPDTDFDGVENRTTTPCTAPFGRIPYNDLGLPKAATLDGWDDFFSYQVSNSTASVNTDWTITTSFHEGNTGVITIKDRSGNPDLLEIVAVIVSHGKNGLGAYTIKGTQNTLPDSTALPDEYQNTAPAASPDIFYKREYTDNPSATGGSFDDVVMVLGANDLLVPLIKDGTMKSADGQWGDQTSKINDALATSMFTNAYGNCAPPSTQVIFTALLTANGIATADPWGVTFTYSQLITKMKNDGEVKPASTTYPYSITASKAINTPSNVTLYGKYQGIIQNTCP